MQLVTQGINADSMFLTEEMGPQCNAVQCPYMYLPYLPGNKEPWSSTADL